MDKMISLFGGYGFIGSWIYGSDPRRFALHHRGVVTPSYNKILWLVSTVDNYNIHTDPYRDIGTNLTTLIHGLESARQKFGNDFEFNFISSWFVYGKIPDVPARESSYCNPTGFYSITKRAAEQLLISYCTTYGIKWRILRLANVMGVGDKKISKKKNALQYMIRELAQGRSIDLYRGEFVRDFIDVRDVVRAISLVLEKGRLNEIFNVGNGEGVNISYVIDCLCMWDGFSPSLINVIDVPEFHQQVQVDRMFLDISKIKALGYKRKYSLNDTLEWLVQYYKEE